MRQRRFVGVVVAVGCLIGLTGCYGPVTTTGLDITVDCIASAPGYPTTDDGTQTVHVSLDTPQWSNPGATVPLANMTASGFDSTVQGAEIAQVLVSLHGLGDFETEVPSEPMFPPLWTVSDGFARLYYVPAPGAFGSVTSFVTAPPKGTATVDLTEIDFLFVIPVNGINEEGLIACTPLAGQPTRLATIGMRGDHNY